VNEKIEFVLESDGNGKLKHIMEVKECLLGKVEVAYVSGHIKRVKTKIDQASLNKSENY